MAEYTTGINTKSNIYHTARKLFYEKGISKTSYTDICEGAQVNRGLIPYHFKSKNNIAIEVLNQFVDSMESAVDKQWDLSQMPPIESNIMVELMMFKLLASNQNICRFYHELHNEPSFREATFEIQEEVMRLLASRSNIQVSNEALHTIIPMVEGTEAELTRAIYLDYIQESIEDMVRRDISCCFFLLGVDAAEVNAHCDHVFQLAQGYTMVCNSSFECSIVKEQ